MKDEKIPLRSEIPQSDKWDLSTLFENDSDWEAALSQIERDADAVVQFQGRLGERAETLLAVLKA